MRDLLDHAHAQGSHGDVAWLSGMCSDSPHSPDLWVQLAQLLADLGRDGDAQAALRSGLAANPGDMALLTAQAEVCVKGKRFAQGVTHYKALLTVEPHNVRNLVQLGQCLQFSYILKEAAACYQEALRLCPDLRQAHTNLGSVLWRLGDFDGSLRHAEKAFELEPGDIQSLCILGGMLIQLNRLDDAEQVLRHLLARVPDFPPARSGLAYLLLQAGRFEEGWLEHQKRWDDGTYAASINRRRPELEWAGPAAQPLHGKTILFYYEQCWGDVIQLVRYVRLLQRGGATVYCDVQPELVPLVESIPGVTCLKPGQASVAADYQVAMFELPLHYRSDEASIPREVPYLHASPDKAARWRQKMSRWDGQLKVGIAWVGNRIHLNQQNRCTPLSAFKDIIDLPGVQCFSLQKSDGEQFTDVAVDADRLVDFTPEWQDFSDSAAMVANLDLIISVDSAVVHLAAAMGKPTWVILPPNADWRWLLEREDSPWYPTMKLFRRSHDETRAAQMARVVKALKALLKKR